jgi:hypothetical protein
VNTSDKYWVGFETAIPKEAKFSLHLHSPKNDVQLSYDASGWDRIARNALSETIRLT